MFDGPDHEMTDRAADNVFVQDTSHVVDDDVELALVGSELVSFGPGDVVVAFFAGEKGDGSLPSSTADEKGRVVCRRTLVASRLGQTDYRCVVVHPADP
ncbi:hypothetical protein Tco_0181481, partial [Tanacetum coccineum]